MNLTELFDYLAALIRDGFNAAVQDIADNVILEQLTAAIEAGDYDLAFRLLGVMPGSFRPLTRAIENAFEQGAKWVADKFPKVLYTPDGKGVFRFNIADPRAERWIRNESSTLITAITDDTRASVRIAMENGIVSGRNPRDTARDIAGYYDRDVGRRVGGVIGLTDQQTSWVNSARLRLSQAHLPGGGGERYLGMKLRNAQFDGIVEQAMRTGKPLTREQVEKLTIKYADRVLKFRADTIARTESIGAFAASDYEATKQVVDMGAARPKDIRRFWDDASDLRVRHTHEEMNGQEVGLDEPFVSPSGARLMYPHDRSLGAPADEIIACRCHVRTEIDWIGAAIND